jgi:hypothetical protein
MGIFVIKALIKCSSAPVPCGGAGWGSLSSSDVPPRWEDEEEVVEASFFNNLLRL